MPLSRARVKARSIASFRRERCNEMLIRHQARAHTLGWDRMENGIYPWKSWQVGSEVWFKVEPSGAPKEQWLEWKEWKHDWEQYINDVKARRRAP
jgi:hypothetical protein